MALMDTTQRKLAWRKFMNDNTENWGNVLKADLSAAIDAVDIWVNDNQASYNNGLPATTKAELTTAQKSNLLTAVVAVRFQEGV